MEIAYQILNLKYTDSSGFLVQFFFWSCWKDGAVWVAVLSAVPCSNIDYFFPRMKNADRKQ